MTLTKQDKAVLQALVKQELKVIKEKGEEMMISNSPFLGTVIKDVPDLPFIKGERGYQEFLEKRLKKL